MKKYLLLLVLCVCATMGAWAADISGTGISGATDESSGEKVQTLVVSSPGALATWVASQTGDNYDANNPFQGLGDSDDFFSLKISGTLNADDIAALNAATCGAFSRFPRIDMSEVTLEEGVTSADVCAVNFGPGSFVKGEETISGTGAKYIRLPNSMTSAEDVKLMAKMNVKNTALEMVGAYDGSDTTHGAKVALQSFKANSVPGFIADMNVPTSGNPTLMPTDIKMSGKYGDKDLVNVDTPTMGYGTSAKWDFTGAHFEECTEEVTDKYYYDNDDPFRDHPLVTSPTKSNTFTYFKQYRSNVVDIKLPDDNMEVLPAYCLNEMGQNNKDGYVMLYGEEQFNENKISETCVPIETLVIPDCYTDLYTHCCDRARICHVVIGSGMKKVHGYAFDNCKQLEDLDFAAGLSDCYLGDHAFNENDNMKHIALSEGIVSLGACCFFNSQHLESIRLPETLVNIGDNAFNNCLALSSITIPPNVQKIGRSAFVLCPLTDIFLMTTDPERIPIMWSVGNRATYTGISADCSFYSSAMYGWGTMQAINMNSQNIWPDFDEMTWEEAAEWYFINGNGLPVLHYTKELAEKVRADISATYYAHTKADESGKTYGLPIWEDFSKRSGISADKVGGENGMWTNDGWSQFILMKEFLANDPHSDVYTKEYDDVWYTMCFPFDLTDEQLAAAFNETFNIVDFSAVEIKDPQTDSSVEKKTLVLHFNNVAVTDYKDVEGNHYTRVMDNNGKAVREQDGKYQYNVYLDEEGNEYHHVITLTGGDMTKAKTKTFVRGTSLENAKENYTNKTYPAVLIDGILATAGHPYMIHPAIGVNDGGTTKKNCTFAGISWLPQGSSEGKPLEGWRKVFEEQSRTIDLGIAKNDSNYNQSEYTAYTGQKYTFMGNYHEYDNSVLTSDLGDEPQVPEEPSDTRPSITLQEYEAQNKPTDVENPNIEWTEVNETLYQKLTSSASHELVWYGETEITAEYNDGSTQWNNWSSKKYLFQNLSGVPDPYSNEEGCFNMCKSTFNNKAKVAAYEQYLEDLQAYQAGYNALEAAWDQYNNYDTYKQQYDNAVAAHKAWEENAKKYKVQIPQHAYFLGRKAGAYPKYYRETAEEVYPSTRKSGIWPQFSAVIIPNQAAVNGLEAELDNKTAQSKGFDMAFNEDFMGEILDIDEGIATVIEEAIKTDGKADVEYMDIVVSINGQIVREGTTSIEGLPKGLYIVNGKKYFVK